MKSRFLVGYKQRFLYPTRKNMLNVSHKNRKQACFTKYHIKKNYYSWKENSKVFTKLCTIVLARYCQGIGKTSILSTTRAD